MIPEMFFNEMVRCEYQYKKHDDAQAGKKHIHPLLVKQIYPEGIVKSRFMAGVVGVAVLVPGMVHMAGTFRFGMGMSGVVVSQMSCGKSRYEDCKSDEHRDALPAEMTSDRSFDFFGMTVVRL